MIRKAGAFIVLIGILALLCGIYLATLPRKAKTWIVDDDGPSDFHSIQQAVNAAGRGDTILVRKGTYFEHVVLNKSLSLIGESRLDTIVDGNQSGRVIAVMEDNTEVSGFTIQRGGSTAYGPADSGLYVNSSHNVITENIFTDNRECAILLDSFSHNNTVASNVMMKNWQGCLLLSSMGNTLTSNSVTDHGGDGIYLWDSSDNVISDNGHGITFTSSANNDVTGNTIDHNGWGITFASSSRNTLRNNSFTGNRFGLDLKCNDQLSYFIQDVDQTNIINGKPVIYWINHHNEQVNLDAGFTALVNCTDITVKNQSLSENWAGIILAGTHNSTLQDLSITNSSNGIFLFGSDNNTVRHCEILDCEVGINLVESSNNIIDENNVTSTEEGIILNGPYNSVTGNYLFQNKYRGVFSTSPNNTIAYNEIIENGMAGIGVSSTSEGVAEGTIHDNNIVNNTIGIQLSETRGYTICHNNFIDNKKQAEVSFSNVWDNGLPSGGNYWSDYLVKYPDATEIDETGIGDTPYVIDENNVDHYPLVAPFALHQPWSQ